MLLCALLEYTDATVCTVSNAFKPRNVNIQLGIKICFSPTKTEPCCNEAFGLRYCIGGARYSAAHPSSP